MRQLIIAGAMVGASIVCMDVSAAAKRVFITPVMLYLQNQRIEQKLDQLNKSLLNLKSETEKRQAEIVSFDQCEKDCDRDLPHEALSKAGCWSDEINNSTRAWCQEEQKKRQECWKKCEKIRPAGIIGQC
jgi:hypothetical protein